MLGVASTEQPFPAPFDVAEEAPVFVFWSRATEEHVRTLLAAKQQQDDEHAAAVGRIVEQAHEDDQDLPTWDGPTFGAWNDRPGQ